MIRQDILDLFRLKPGKKVRRFVMTTSGPAWLPRAKVVRSWRLHHYPIGTIRLAAH
jgi:hypothetical protein